MKKWLVLLAFVVVAFGAGQSRAQDEGLYDPVAPEGSAFVRLINAGTADQAAKPEIRGKAYNEVGHNKAGAYVPVKEGQADIAVGAAKASETLESGAYYTAVLKGETLTVLKDEALKDQSKAIIGFYNLTGKKLSLKTADGKIEVVPAVEPGKAGYREINPLAVQLAVFDGDTKTADVPNVELKRNAATGVMAKEDKDKVEAVQFQATTDTTQ